MHVRTAMRGVPLRGQLEKVLQQQMAVLRRDAFRMELHAVHGKRLVREAHDQAVAGFGSDAERVRHGVTVDHQRVVARCLERTVDATEYAGALEAHFGKLAMHRLRRPYDAASERLADGLVAEAHAENWDLRRSLFDQIEADAGLV